MAKCQKECAFSTTEDYLPWRGMGLNVDVGAPVTARIESILSAVKSIRLGQSLTVKPFQRLLGLMAAASNMIPFGLLYLRPLQWWLRTKGFSPKGNKMKCAIQNTVDLINNNIIGMCKRNVQAGCNGYVHIAAIRMMENGGWFTVYWIESCKCYLTKFKFRSLMAWGKKLLLSLSVFCHHAPEALARW